MRPDVVGVCETHCVITEDLPKIEGYEWVMSPGTERSAGVGLLISKEIEIEVGEMRTFVEGRVIATTLGAMALIEAYSPVEGGDEIEIEAFYTGLNEAIAWCRGLGKLEIAVGDFNAHIRGWWSLDTNKNGQRLKSMCAQWDMELLQLDRPTHLHSSGNAFCLDYAVINRELLDKLVDFNVNDDNPVESDHLPITLKIWGRCMKTNEVKRKRIRIDRLKNPIFLEQYRRELDRELMLTQGEKLLTIDQEYEALNFMMLGVAERVLGVAENRIKGALDEIALRKLQEARQYRWKALKALKRKKDETSYRALMARHRQGMKEFNNELRRISADSWRERKIEQAVIGAKDMWEVLRRLKRSMRSRPARFTRAEESKLIGWWKTQYNDKDTVWTSSSYSKPPTKEEVKDAIGSLGNRKATGPDGVPSELIKYGGDAIVEKVWKLISDMWKQRHIPTEMKRAMVTLIPKKLGSKESEDYRPITLLNAAYKVLDKIVADRLTKEIKTKSIMNPVQAGFMARMSTTDQIFRLETVIELCRAKKKGIICAFLDISKAFDTVKHSDLNEVMANRGIDPDTVSVLGAMYDNCDSRVIVNDRLSDSISIRKGVRQGGSSSPICFNLIPNELAWAITNAGIGITLSAEADKLGLLLYADDIVLMAHTVTQLQQLLDICSAWASRYTLKINQMKSVVVDYSIRSTKVAVVIDGKQLKQVKQFKYLGKVIGASKVKAVDAVATLERVKSAGRATRALLGGMHCISIYKKSIIAEACVTTVATYAKECTQHEPNGAALKCAENERMRLARMLLHAPTGTAREASLLDIGWITIENHIRMHLLRFRRRVYAMTDQLSVLIRTINANEVLPWEKRCKEAMKLLNVNDQFVRGKPDGAGELEWKIVITSAAKKLNMAESVHRLNVETEKTTRLYRSLLEGIDCISKPTFITVNPNNGGAIGAIHRLRAGFNFCNANAKLRHLGHDDMCGCCGVTETEEHVLTACTRYTKHRKELQDELEWLGIDWSEIGFVQVVLYGALYEAHVMHLRMNRREDIVNAADAAIKKFHLAILKDKAWTFKEEQKLMMKDGQTKITSWLIKSS